MTIRRGLKPPLLWVGIFCLTLRGAPGMLPGDQDGRKYQFEVASVKRAETSERPPGAGIKGKIIGGPGTADPGQVTGSMISLSTLIRTAYDLAPDQLSGPGWFQSQTYDIAAKVPPGASKEDVKPMLLADRFRLVFHRDRKEIDAYALTIAGGGSKLKATACPDAKPLRLGASATSSGVDADGYPVIPAGTSGAAAVSRNGMMCWSFQSVPVSTLIANVQSELGSRTTLNTWSPGRVIDETGLSAKYDFRFCYASDGQIGGALRPEATHSSSTQENGVDSADPGGPSVFAAVEKQLGLKLVKRRVWLEVFAVDHVEQIPMEN